MHQPPRDSTTRFSNRVENYVRFRPTYPDGVIQILQHETSLTTASVIADVGSGTGISSKLFLRNGNEVFGIEPNPEMRQAAETMLEGYSNFHSVAASAEATHASHGERRLRHRRPGLSLVRSRSGTKGIRTNPPASRLGCALLEFSPHRFDAVPPRLRSSAPKVRHRLP